VRAPRAARLLDSLHSLPLALAVPSFTHARTLISALSEIAMVARSHSSFSYSLSLTSGGWRVGEPKATLRVQTEKYGERRRAPWPRAERLRGSEPPPKKPPDGELRASRAPDPKSNPHAAQEPRAEREASRRHTGCSALLD